MFFLSFFSALPLYMYSAVFLPFPPSSMGQIEKDRQKKKTPEHRIDRWRQTTDITTITKETEKTQNGQEEVTHPPT